ncbi:hypothetical protein ACICHK_04245 [Streptomyces sp. AHU1]|uniref:hypothetical protein n=1 Tax=Streptomyces sp. AHU1 TaxID=3377215 RepID=UPI003877BF9C
MDRFIEWESRQSRRTAALACALPGTVNQNVVDVLLGGQDGVELYEWLRGMSRSDEPTG